jgi:hypothetical protein
MSNGYGALPYFLIAGFTAGASQRTWVGSAPKIRKAVRRVFLAHCVAFLFGAGAAGQTTGTDPKLVPGALDVQQVLSWLPTDTETVVVAKDFLLPDLARLQSNRELNTKEVGFQWTALGAWGLRTGRCQNTSRTRGPFLL